MKKSKNNTIDSKTNSSNDISRKRAIAAEQKAGREKLRRSELNENLGELSEILFEIEPSLRSGRRNIDTGAYNHNALSHNMTSSSKDFAVTNRIELIKHSVQLLRRLHQENQEKDIMIKKLNTTVSFLSSQQQQQQLSKIVHQQQQQQLSSIIQQQQEIIPSTLNPPLSKSMSLPKNIPSTATIKDQTNYFVHPITIGGAKNNALNLTTRGNVFSMPSMESKWY